MPVSQRTREALFSQAYPFASRAARVRSAAAVARERGLDREDLEQEALVCLWRAIARFDTTRGSIRTFVEHVVANRIASLVRSSRSHRAQRFSKESFQNMPGTVAPYELVDLRMDTRRIIGELPVFDRAVALRLTEHSVVETSRRLNVSRAAVYRAIARLRVAFLEVGLSPTETRLRIPQGTGTAGA
jgi:RNA polymerase sigma factor (sigma-70 family)